MERTEFAFVSDDADLVARTIGVMCHFPKDHVDPTIRFLEKARRKRSGVAEAGRALIFGMEGIGFDDQVDGYWFVCDKGFRVTIAVSGERIFDWDVFVNLSNEATEGFLRLQSVLEGLPPSTELTKDTVRVDLSEVIARIAEMHFAKL